MIGPLLLAVSWLLLRLEGRSLAALGIDAPGARARQFTVAFLFLGTAAAVQQLGLALAADVSFVRNETLRPALWLENLRFTLNSVLYEELVFRGYLLYQAVRFIGARRAVLLDGAAFGIYHWFSYGVIGNPVAMVYVFLLTGAYGWMWARAFVATGSVVAPIGLHLGWNAVSYLAFSAGPLPAGLFVPSNGTAPPMTGGWASLALNVLLPAGVTVAGLWYYGRVEHERRLPRRPPAESR